MMIIYTVDKMVTAFNEDSQDWSGHVTDFGIVEEGYFEAESVETAVKSIGGDLGLEGFKPVEDEKGRFEMNQCEDDDGMEDKDGKWLADYNIYFKVYQEVA